MAASLDDFARTMRTSLEPHAERILAEVRTLSPREAGPLQASAPPPASITIRRRSLRCLLGFHQWKYFTLVLFGVIDMGEQRRSCERCGKWAHA